MSEMIGRRVIAAVVCVVLFLGYSGCGTLLYPERLDATPSNKIDSKTLILDCAWLLVGVVPGIVALGVDFYNDTIYLSEGELSAGQRVSLNVRGKAPADCNVALHLVNANGHDLTPPVTAEVRAGEALSRDFGLTVPSDAELDGATLVVSLDGQPQTLWQVR